MPRRWEEAFENGELPADLGIERLVDLRARRDELRGTLTKVVPIQPPRVEPWGEVLASVSTWLPGLGLGTRPKNATPLIDRPSLAFVDTTMQLAAVHSEVIVSAGEPHSGGA